MYVELGVNFLADVPLSNLEAAYVAEKQGKAKLRLQCAILRKKGKRQPFIASVTGLPLRTVSGILRRFNSRGIEACHAIKQNGQPRKLNSSQEKVLAKAMSRSPVYSDFPFVIWTTKVVRFFLEAKFGVTFVAIQIHRILRRLGLSRQRARPEHVKANKQLQKKWKKKFSEDFAILGRVDLRSYFWTSAPFPSNPITL